MESAVAFLAVAAYINFTTTEIATGIIYSVCKRLFIAVGDIIHTVLV